MSMHASEHLTEHGIGGVFHGGVLMLIGGVMAGLTGLAAVLKTTFYVVPANYWITLSVSAWGWTLLAVGAVLLLTGLTVLFGAGWARWLGIGVVSVAAVVSFLFVAIAPYVAVVLVALDLWALHSLTLHAKEPQLIYFAEREPAASRTAQAS